MEEIELKELFDYLKTKLLVICIIVMVFIILGNLFTIITRTPMYQSDTTIILVGENKTEGYNSNELQFNKNLVSTYSVIIKSRKVLNPTINNLGLDYTYQKLKSNVSVSAVEDTEIIKITVFDSDKELASRIANEIANVFSIEAQKRYKLNNVSILDEAEVSNKPYNINYLKDNMIYIALALALSISVYFVIFYFDTSIKTSDEIENKLGLTVIGIVPKVEGE